MLRYVTRPTSASENSPLLAITICHLKNIYIYIWFQYNPDPLLCTLSKVRIVLQLSFGWPRGGPPLQSPAWCRDAHLWSCVITGPSRVTWLLTRWMGSALLHEHSQSRAEIQKDLAQGCQTHFGHIQSIWSQGAQTSNAIAKYCELFQTGMALLFNNLGVNVSRFIRSID